MLLRMMSVKKILGEYLSGGCDSLSDLRGMTGLVAPGVDVGWSEAEPFGCAESEDSVLEMSVTVEIQAQHRPDRLKKPRTESVGTDRLGRVPSRLGPIGYAGFGTENRMTR